MKKKNPQSRDCETIIKIIINFYKNIVYFYLEYQKGKKRKTRTSEIF